MQKIAFLYLNTGGGHVAPARALAEGISKKYPKDCETFLLHGFGSNMQFERFFFEDGYRIVSNYFESGYVLFYQMTANPLQIKLGNYFLSLKGVSHLTKFFKEKGITKVVCLHEILILMARKAINRINPSIPLITILTDPFTAHPLWFYEKNTDLIVFSNKLKDEAITRYGCSPEKVHSFNFILSPAYDTPYTSEQIAQARRRHSIPDGKRVLLIAGGGEGLRGAEWIVNHFINKKRPEILIVVCGRNRLLRLTVQDMVQISGAKNVFIHGFVSCMPDLLNIADCIITKGGASTVMEVLAVRKPAIFSTYIRGQELGNVLFSINNGVGWYIKQPAKILQKALSLLESDAERLEIKRKIESLDIKNGLYSVIEYIHDKKNP